MFLQLYYNSYAYNNIYSTFTKNFLIKTFIFLFMRSTQTLSRSFDQFWNNWSEYEYMRFKGNTIPRKYMIYIQLFITSLKNSDTFVYTFYKFNVLRQDWKLFYSLKADHCSFHNVRVQSLYQSWQKRSSSARE